MASKKEKKSQRREHEMIASVVGRLKIFESQNSTADFKIVHGDDQWPVHRFVLALHSDVLEKVCYGDFEEAANAKVDLSTEPKAILRAFIHYLYHLKYDVLIPDTLPRQAPDAMSGLEAVEATSNDHEPVGELSFHAKMALLADYYNVPHLQWIAGTSFKDKLKTSKGKENIRDIHQAAHILYFNRSGMADLCQDLVMHMLNNECLFERDSSRDSSAEHMLKAVPALAADYAAALRLSLREAGKELAEPVFRCPVCEYIFQMDCTQGDEQYQCLKFNCDFETSGKDWRDWEVISARGLPKVTSSWWQKD